MVWIFERNQDRFRLETRYDKIAGQYVLTMVRPDGSEQHERFSDEPSFRARLATLEEDLQSNQWVQRTPIFLRDGWRL